MSEPIRLNLVVNEKQEQFLYSSAKYQLYGGAKGGGKSWAIRTKQLIRRLKYAGSRGLTMRRTYPELKRTHIDKILVDWKGLGTWNGSSKQFTFHNGSIQEFGSCQYEMDVRNFQGAEYDDIGIDEATQFTEYMIETLKTNIRTVRQDLKTAMYFGANPGGVGHGYIKRTFVRDDSRLPDHDFIPAKVTDNFILMQNDPEYAANLAKLPDNLRRAFLDGDWDIFEGQALPEFNQAKHVTTKFPYPLDACKKIICFDRGYNAPGCAAWLAFTPENSQGVSHVFCYRELYQSRKTPEEWADQISALLRVEQVKYMVLPHDCFANVDGRPSYAQIFGEKFGNRCPIVRGNTLAQGARHQRLAILHGKLQDSPDGTPYLQFHPNCKNIVRTLPELVCDEFDPEDIDTDGEDHGYDAVTLGLMTETGRKTIAGPMSTTQSLGRAKITPALPVNKDGRYSSPDFVGAFSKELRKKHRVVR